MASKRVTMQDIADACGLSRNTVSKVFNGRGTVPPATRALILQKAGEVGYGLPAEEKPAASQQVGGSIALLTNHMPVDYHFGTFFRHHVYRPDLSGGLYPENV
jgi:transcriptional regulator, LacI family